MCCGSWAHLDMSKTYSCRGCANQGMRQLQGPEEDQARKLHAQHCWPSKNTQPFKPTKRLHKLGRAPPQTVIVLSLLGSARKQLQCIERHLQYQEHPL